MFSSLLDKSGIKVTFVKEIIFPLTLCLLTQETSRKELVIKGGKPPACGGRALQVKKERQSRVVLTLGRADFLLSNRHGQALI